MDRLGRRKNTKYKESNWNYRVREGIVFLRLAKCL